MMSDTRGRRRALRSTAATIAGIAALFFGVSGGESAKALVAEPSMTFLGTFGSMSSCQSAMNHNNGVGLPGEFICFRWFGGEIYGVYVDDA